MASKKGELLKLFSGIQLLGKTYDALRIVDPVAHKVLEIQENRVLETDLGCYHFWKKDKACDNCVALKAFQENDIFIKLEYHQEKVYMVLAIPIAAGEERWVLELFKDVSKNMLVVRKDGAVEYDVQSIIANADALLLQDHLTEVFNRRYIDERLPVDVFNNSLHKRSLSLIMADIDHFKNINDSHGHLAGDFILKEIAALLVNCTRKGKDWVARYGGEEFLICLPNTDKAKAAEIAERMRQKIESRVFEYEKLQIRLTISFGVYTLGAESESSIESLIRFADHNLYEAKNSGRNKVVAS